MSNLFRENPALQLAEASPWALLLLKITLLLAVGWAGHWLLARRNPRYRLFWWRGVVCAIGLTAVVSVCSPAMRISVERPATADNTTATTPELAIEYQNPIASTKPNTGRKIRPAVNSTPPEQNRTQSANPGIARIPVAARKPMRATGTPEQSIALTAASTQAVRSTAFGAALEPIEFRPSATTIIAAIWLLGLAAGLSLFVAGMIRVRRLLKRAQPMQDAVLEECRRIADSLGASQRVTFHCHKTLPSPVLVGVVHPKVILPTWMTRRESQRDLPAVLAHELSHVRSRDLLWQLLLHAASLILWFHPFAWRLRRAHLADCERKADLDSAAFLGETGSYIRTLARVALRVAALVPQPGMAMARGSDVSQRVGFLQQAKLPKPLRTRLIAVGGLLGTFAVFLLGSLRFAVAEPVTDSKTKPAIPAAKKDQSNTRKFTVRLVDAAGKPVTKGRIQVRIVNDRKYHPVGKDGTLTVNLPKKQPRLFGLWIKAPGYVWAYATWSNFPDRLSHSIPKEITFRMERGDRIGGRVVDETGQPIAGATVEVRANGREATPDDRRTQSLYKYQVTTDKSGRWKTDSIIPKKAVYFSLLYSHADFINGAESESKLLPRMADLKKLKHTFTLKRGHSVEGVVTGPDGKPVVGAVVAIGRSPWSGATRHMKPKTDKNGIYRFKNVPEGETLITVVSKNHAPDMQRVHVSDELDTVDFKLKKGKPLKLRVINKAGEPVAGVRVIPDTWRGNRTLLGLYDGVLPQHTGKDGRYLWKHAPDDEILFDILPKQYMAERDRGLKPQDKEYVITVIPRLRITGTAIDAKTKKPIKQFTIMRGYHLSRGAEIYWDRYQKSHGRDGKFRFDVDGGRPLFYFQAKAKGYAPAVSKPVKRDAGKASIAFELTRARGPKGIVTYRGKPVAEATVHLCRPNGGGPYVRNGGIADRHRGGRETTDKNGAFEFEPVVGPYAFLVTAKAGYARVSQAEFERNPKIELQPWARVEGRIMKGGKPWAGASISLNLDNRNRSGEPHMYFDYDATADRDGRFVFSRVPTHLNAVVGRDIVLRKHGGMTTHGFSHGKPVKLTPGKTTEVVLGGTGRPVIGRLSLPGVDRKKIAWNAGFNYLQLVRPRAPVLPGMRRPYTPSYSIRIKPDGSFRVEDIPPGTYNLSLSAYEESVANRGRPGRGKQLGSHRGQFKIDPIPGGRTDKPLDLGTIKLK